MKTTIEQLAENTFKRFGTRLDIRFEKLREEVDELFQAYSKYESHKGSLEHVRDELSDVEAVLAHIRSIISEKSHDESLLDSVLKVRIREYDKNYMK